MTEKTSEKQRAGFKPDQSGNPSGRPRGARNRVTMAIEALLEGEAEALTRKVIERALEGDAAALRLCLDRLAPPRRDRPTPFDLPAVKEAADCRDAFAAIIAATAEGELTSGEAATLTKLIVDFAALDAATEVTRGIRHRREHGPLSGLNLLRDGNR